MASTSSHHHAHHAHCSHSHPHPHPHSHPHHEPLRYSQPTQADEDLLNLITSPSFHLPTNHTPTRRPLSTLAALRRPPIDPIVLAATLSSGPHVTRHHFHHSFDGQPPDVGRSQQMPASVRRARMVQSQEQAQQVQTQVKAQERDRERDREAVTSSAARASAAAAALSPPPAPTPEAPRYISAQAPRSVRLAREPGTAESNPHLQKPPAAPTPTPTASTESITSTSTRRPSAAAPASTAAPPQLVVRCHARTRIPTPHGEVFAYIYKNNLDNKEHLALVVDPSSNDEGAVEYYRAVSKASGGRVGARKGEIRSRSLDELWSVGESDMERIVRGAYVGRLGADYQIASAPPLPLPSSSSLLEEEEDEEEELEPPLVRIHSECYTGETIGSQRCDCGEQLDEAIRLIAAEDEIMNPPRHRHHSHSHSQTRRRRGKDVDDEHLAFSQQLPPSDAPLTGAPPSPALSSSQQFFPFSPNPNNSSNTKPPRRARGIVVYLRQEGRGIGLLDKLMAYNLQDMGHDTVSANILLGHSADARTYDIAAAMLRDLGVGLGGSSGGSGVRLLTNNPEKVEGMEREGVRVVERVPMVPRMWRTRGESSGRRRRRARESSTRKKERKAKKERGGGGIRASGMTPSSSAGAGTGTVFRPSLLGVHSRILSQASGFGTESEDERDENTFEDRDRDGEFSQAEEEAGSMTRSTSGQQEDEDGHASQLEHPSSPSSSRSSSPSVDSDDSDSDDSYTAHVLRRSGATMIGADVTRSAELERYLRTKVERMGHLLDVPGGSRGAGAGAGGSRGGQGSGSAEREREKGA